MKVVYLVIVACVIALYASHLRSAEWVYEDQRWLWATNGSALPQSLSSRSLVASSWALTPTPQRAHAVSVVLHLAVVGLVGLLLSRLGLSRLAVFGGMSLLAVHRLTVETVAYAAARSDLLAALGILLAIVSAAGAWWRPWGILGMVAGLLIAWGGKETALVALALIPLTWWVQAERRRAPPTALSYGLVCLWLCGLVAVMVLGRDSLRGIVNIGELPGGSITWPAWLAVQSTAAVRLFGAVVLPLQLTADYDYDLVAAPLRWAAVGVLGVVGTLMLWQIKRRPLVAYGLAWALLALTPRLLVQTPRGYLNEHQFYVPLIGCLIAAVAPWDEWRAQAAV